MKRINRWYIFSMKTELSYLAFLNSFPSIPFYFVLIARLRRGDCSPSGQGFREQLKRYRVTRYTPCYVPMNIKIRFRADCGRTDFNRSIKPSDSSCRLDAKPKLPRRLFKNQNRQTSPFRQHHCHFRQKRYNRYFLTVETNVRPSGWTAEGRQEQTDKLPNNPSGIRTLVGSDIGWLRRWAIGRNILRFYGSARINVPTQRTYYCRQERVQYATGTTPNCAKQTPQAATKPKTEAASAGLATFAPNSKHGIWK